MSITTWRDAVRSDTADLHAFTCTERKTFHRATRQHSHPKMWEYEAQSMIRSQQPPIKNGRRLLVGHDDQGLAWVSRYDELDGPGAVELVVMGVDRRHRGTGGQVAREMIDATLETIFQVAEAAGVPEVSISGQVFCHNQPSLKMCAEVGLEPVGWGAPQVRIVGARMLIAGASVPGDPDPA